MLCLLRLLLLLPVMPAIGPPPQERRALEDDVDRPVLLQHQRADLPELRLRRVLLQPLLRRLLRQDHPSTVSAACLGELQKQACL